MPRATRLAGGSHLRQAPAHSNGGRHAGHLLRDRAHPLRGTRERQPARVPVLRQGSQGPRQAHGGPAPVRRLLVALLRLDRFRSLRLRHLRPSVDAIFRPHGSGAPEGRVGVRLLREAGRPVLHLPRPRHRPRGTDAARVPRPAPGDGRGAGWAPAADRGAPALGNRQPVQPPALHGGSRHQSGPGGLCHGGRAGQGGHGRHPRARRAELRPLGRPGRLRDPPQYGRQARAGAAGPVPRPRRRLQAPQRIQRHDPGGAQALRALQASVRFRHRHPLRLPPALRAREGGQGQRRGQPLHPGRPLLRARDRRGPGVRHLRQRRHEPWRPAPGLGHRPVPEQRARGDAGAVCHFAGGRLHYRRIELRREAAPPVDRPRRSVSCPCRRDGCLRACAPRGGANDPGRSARERPGEPLQGLARAVRPGDPPGPPRPYGAVAEGARPRRGRAAGLGPPRVVREPGEPLLV